MPFYALDQDLLVFAPDAQSGHLYRCPECFETVKKRDGFARFPHFYHIKAPKHCRLSSKSETHLLLQLHLQKQIGPTHVRLEQRFEKIQRIADVCWEKEKVIFEIQCSLISLQEVQSRIEDYQSLGYEVIWLFHDRLYNRFFLRAEEAFLRLHKICYFFHISKGTFFCYDQFEQLQAGRRLRKSRPLPVRLSSICQRQKQPFPFEVPRQITLETAHYFPGDRWDLAVQAIQSPFLRNSLHYWKLLEEETEQKTTSSLWKKTWLEKIYWPYLHFLHRLIR